MRQTLNHIKKQVSSFFNAYTICDRNIFAVKGYLFFRALIFGYVIERLYWASKGIGIGDQVILEMVYASVLTLSEIPTGIWADRWSRRHTIVIGSFLALISNTLLLVGTGFAAFAASSVLSAVYGALTSGSVNALLYDSLLSENRANEFPKVLASIKKWRSLAYLIAALGGSVMASVVNMTLNYQLSVVSCVLAVLFTCLLKEPVIEKQHTKNESTHWSALYWKEGLKLIRTNAVLVSLATGVVIGSSIIYIEEYWQCYCQELNLPISSFGIISVLFTVSTWLSGHFIEHFDQTNWWQQLRKKGMVLVGLCYALTLVLTGIQATMIGLALMMFATFFNAIADVDALTTLHEHTDSAVRAGIESVYSMTLRAASLGFGFVFGINDSTLVSTRFKALGLSIFALYMALILVGLLIKMYRRSHVKRSTPTACGSVHGITENE